MTDTPQATPDPFEWAAFGVLDDVRAAMIRARGAGLAFALGTLHAAEGGAPRGVGAQMLVAADGAMAGFLSGGCVEADVAAHARAVLANGAPRRLVYGEGGPPDIRLACGSRIEVLLECVPPADLALAGLLEALAARVPAVWASNGVARACLEPGTRVPQGMVARAFDPPLRLAIIGADPIALALARIAHDQGVEVLFLRPKGPEAPPPAPVALYLRSDIPSAFARIAPDPWTAIAILTHDAEVEHAALAAALATPAFYIGALGSRRRFAERHGRLLGAGFGEAALARIKAPIGLAIGGKSPFAIALAVLAEIVATLPEGAKPNA